jgi:hypothetical protein
MTLRDYLGARVSLATARMTMVGPVVGISHFLRARSRVIFRSLRNYVAWLFIRKFSTVPATDTFCRSTFTAVSGLHSDITDYP